MVKGIGQWLIHHNNRRPEKTALVYKDLRFTYQQLNERVNRLANSFNELGVRKGDRVHVLLFNRNELMETLFACAKIGAIFVPINFRLSAEEVAYIVNDAGGSVFIYEERVKPVVDQMKAQVTSVRHYVQVDGELVDQRYESLIENGENREPAFEILLDEPHMMMYTSGTTGRPKGALLTHGNTQWNALNCIDGLPIDEQMITLTVAPLFHIGGMNIFTTPLLYRGGTVILEDVFHPRTTLEIVQKERVTSLFLVPAMWLAVMQFPNIEEYNLSSLTFSISGGAPCPLTIIEFFNSRGVPFYEGFGLTETAPVVAILDSDHIVSKSGSVGRPPIHVETAVVDPYGHPIPPNAVGELIVKGPHIFKEYWNKPEATKEAIKEGWFYTGDLAKQDEDGFLYIVDRKKDMIITGGENVYPIEVEQILFRHPNVREAAVIGFPDEKWGESIKAVIALKNPEEEMDIDVLKVFCDGKLASFKIPKVIEIVDELPRNATGKVLKTVLRKMNG